MLTFTEWFDVAYGYKWHKSIADKVYLPAVYGYIKYCKLNGYNQVWD